MDTDNEVVKNTTPEDIENITPEVVENTEKEETPEDIGFKYIKDYILTKLGHSYVDVELSDDDIKVIIQQTLDKIAPYYSGRRYVQASGSVIDLSEHNPIAITDVFECEAAALVSIEDFAFGGQNLVIYSADFRDRYTSYTAYKMLYNQFRDLKGADYRYIKPYLYVDGYNKDVLIEMIVRTTKITDIEDTSQWFTWVKEYSLAQAKEIVGRIRSKYTVDGSPYALDGNQLLQEAQAEIAKLEAEREGDIFIV